MFSYGNNYFPFTTYKILSSLCVFWNKFYDITDITVKDCAGFVEDGEIVEFVAAELSHSIRNDVDSFANSIHIIFLFIGGPVFVIRKNHHFFSCEVILIILCIIMCCVKKHKIFSQFAVNSSNIVMKKKNGHRFLDDEVYARFV